MVHVRVPALVSCLVLALAAGCSGQSPEPTVKEAVQHDDPGDDPGNGKTSPPPGPCHDAVAGDGTTCQPYADLKDEATWACAAEGGGLTAMPLADAQGCPDGEAPSAGYTCCLPPE